MLWRTRLQGLFSTHLWPSISSGSMTATGSKANFGIAAFGEPDIRVSLSTAAVLTQSL